uniref:Lymphocyte antigen 96 n=1 Tax=Ovis aries TaxID=9940 RepID=A0AC11BQU5_SHEEP
MFPFVLFSALFSSIFTEPREKRWVCNSSDATVWYDYCDNLKFPISIRSEPCITLKGSRGILYLYYIPRRDIRSLYFNIYLSTKHMNFPLRKEVICRGYDDDFSFCRALKGEYIKKTLGWRKHRLESRLPGEISITSDMQMIPPLRQKVKRN